MRDGSAFPGYWTMDYPRSDRHLLEGVRRLTRIDTRSVEQVVSLDGTDDIYNWPVLYGVEVGHWLLPRRSPSSCAIICCAAASSCATIFTARPYAPEWDTFMDSMSKVFPDRPIEDIPDNDPIFHTLYDLRGSLPGARRAVSGDRHHL